MEETSPGDEHDIFDMLDSIAQTILSSLGRTHNRSFWETCAYDGGKIPIDHALMIDFGERREYIVNGERVLSQYAGLCRGCAARLMNQGLQRHPNSPAGKIADDDREMTDEEMVIVEAEIKRFLIEELAMRHETAD